VDTPGNRIARPKAVIIRRTPTSSRPVSEDRTVADCTAGVLKCHFPSGFGEEEIIDKNNPTINKPATKPETNIFILPAPVNTTSNPEAITTSLRVEA